MARQAGPHDDGPLAELFAHYHDAFRTELGDQDVTGEGRSARAYYDGNIWVAERDGVVVGCAAYESWGSGRARMKRMVVHPDARGLGLGRELAEAVVNAAAAAGFQEMVLDTVPAMVAAQRLYARLGFEPFEPDYVAPCVDTMYMRKSLV